MEVSHHPGKFGDNRNFDKLDLMILICHVTSHNHFF